MSPISTLLVQHLDRARHHLPLVPAYACERGGHPAFRIENVSLEAMSIHQGLDEVHAEREVRSQRLDSVDGPHHTVVCIHSHATIGAVRAQALVKIKARVVRDRCGVDPICESLRFERLLNPRELRDRQRAFERVVASRVEEHDDGWLSAEELVEPDRVAVLIFQHDRAHGSRCGPGAEYMAEHIRDAAFKRAAGLCRRVPPPARLREWPLSPDRSRSAAYVAARLPANRAARVP